MVDKLREDTGVTAEDAATVDINEYVGHATLDVIGLVGFGHDFQCGESPEALAISEICQQSVKTGMELIGFVAPLILRIFPWLLKLPVKAIESQGAVRQLVKKVALQIVQNREAAQDESGKDLLSVLLRMKDSHMDLDNLLDQVSIGTWPMRGLH